MKILHSDKDSNGCYYNPLKITHSWFSSYWYPISFHFWVIPASSRSPVSTGKHSKCNMFKKPINSFSHDEFSEFPSDWQTVYSSLGSRIFPGFIRFFGSRASLRLCMTCIAMGPISSHSSALFPKPTPCSPVHVPSMARARLQGTQTMLLHCKKYYSYLTSSYK